jgi:F-type H+-transporting ATPase subunit epsilon
MADKLHFSLVSPERELYAGAVDHVVAPGSQGEFGVLPAHAPFMTTLKPGVVRILDGATEQHLFVRGGFADVTAEGLTILAEEAVRLDAVDRSKLSQDIQNLREDVADATDPHVKARAAERLGYLEALQAALG